MIASEVGKRRKLNAYVLLFFVLFFLLLFLQFPLKGSISGNCDHWAAISYSNAYLAKFAGLFSNQTIGTSLYPVKDIYSYGESAPLMGLFFILIKSLGFDEVWGSYILIVLVFSFTAFSAYILAREYLKDSWAALFVGIVFSCSNFIFGHIDSIHTVFFTIAFLSIYFAKKFLRVRRKKYLYICCTLAGIQVYFSAYVFLLLVIYLGILVLLNFRDLLLDRQTNKHFAGALFLFFSLCSPFFVFYFSKMNQSGFYKPINRTEVAEMNSLNPKDFLRSLSGNLIYSHKPVTGGDLNRVTELMVKRLGFENSPDPDMEYVGGRGAESDEELHFVSARASANLGIVIYILAIAGFFVKPVWRKELLIVWITGIVIGLGPVISWGRHILPNVLYPLYEHSSLISLIRVPSRAFLLSIFALAMFASYGLLHLKGKKVFKFNLRLPFLVVCSSLFYLVENIPFPFDSFKAKEYQKAPSEYIEYFKDMDGTIVLDLPSDIGLYFGRDKDDLFPYNREIIYMNWQTQHHQNILNGVNGYFPRSRIEVQKLIYELPENEKVIYRLVHDYDLDYIVFHKNMIVYPDEPGILQRLLNYHSLNKIHDSESLTIFRINKAVMEFKQVFERKEEIKSKDNRLWLHVEEGNTANLVFPPDNPERMRINITKATSKTAWDIQLNHPQLSVKADHRYVINFQARADSPRSIAVGFAKAYAPWDGLGLYRNIELRPEWQSFEMDFAATADEDNARLHFDVGGDEIPVELSTIRLRRLSDNLVIEVGKNMDFKKSEKQGGLDEINRAIENGAQFLEDSQSQDGSWPYYRSTSPDFRSRTPEPRIFPTMWILFNLIPTKYSELPFFRKGEDYLLSEMEEGYVWSIEGKNRYFRLFGNSLWLKPDALWLEPDADDTAVGHIVLSNRLNMPGEALLNLKNLFDRNQQSTGLYLSFFEGFYPEKGFIADPIEASLGVNLNILGFLERYKFDVSSLISGIQYLLKQDQYWTQTLYYHSLPILAYFASNAVEMGSYAARSFLQKFIGDFEKEQQTSDYSELSNLDLAALIKAKSHLCMIETEECQKLDIAVIELLNRQNKKGFWALGIFYEVTFKGDDMKKRIWPRLKKHIEKEDQSTAFKEIIKSVNFPIHYYYGSKFETTSFCIKALSLYQKFKGNSN
ncbi:carbohydrate binding domain-containing protein [Acidobacteriota bacterium]